jgi:hydroxymethylpyrimidine pyrophosphatase-like HAD family hydrolase
MRYHALACDYDGTLASHGRVDDETLAALERVRASGRKLLLVSGRQLEDLRTVFERLDLFDRAVLENGALIHDPETGAVRSLAAPPSTELVERLTSAGVQPLSVGHAVVATWEPNETVVLETIRDLGLELQVSFNKGAVMVLPSGINKAVGLAVALEELGLSPHNTVGVGDAENDHAFIDSCELAVAVSNALPRLREHADWVTAGDHGAGVRELVEELVTDDLARRSAASTRHVLVLGADDGGEVLLKPYSTPVLIAGTSGAGKSTLATSLLEQLREQRYQFCVVDPEGDYEALDGAIVLGDSKHAPSAQEVLEVLEKPGHSVVVNLLGLALNDRPAFFASFLSHLLELRGRTGRPHWVLVDEAHHLLPAGFDVDALGLPLPAHGLLLVTVHPESVSPRVLELVGTAVAIGSSPRETLARLAEAAGTDPDAIDPAPLAAGEGLVWQLGVSAGPRRVRLRAPTSERQRHVRKYASGELGPDISFYFRGPDERLNLRAQNLQVFLQLADGVDDETWRHHLERGDYSRWFRERIKDEQLALDAQAVEAEHELAPAESRARIRKAVERRYTAPA